MSSVSCRVQEGDSLTVTLTLVECGSTTPLDISTATAQSIILKGKGVRVENTSSFVTDGTDGKITAIFTPGQISTDGKWQVQGFVTLPGSVQHHTEIRTFEVIANL